MARPPRLSLPSYPHHVIQRGNNLKPIFLAPEDYADWLETSISGEEWDQIRIAPQQVGVVGSDSFQEKVGSRVGKQLNGETRGRPKRVNRSEITL